MNTDMDIIILLHRYYYAYMYQLTAKQHLKQHSNVSKSVIRKKPLRAFHNIY